MMNIFTHGKPEAYKRKARILPSYIEDNAVYLSKVEGIPLEEAREFIKSNIGAGKKFEPVSPKMIYAYSPTRGNKELGECTLWDYAMDIVAMDYIMAPSMTSYCPPEVIETPSTPFIFKKSKQRDELKLIKFNAKLDGDKFLYESSDAGQNKVKVYSNSLSGAYTVASTSLYNATGHSSLTSTCRAGVSYANANNERFIMGLRHYHTVDVTVAAILTVCTKHPLDDQQKVMEKYNLHYPTVDEMMACIIRSTEMNWKSTTGQQEIKKLVDKCTPIERASFVYTADLFHLEKYNPEFIDSFINCSYTQVTDHKLTTSEAQSILKSVDNDVRILALYICDEYSAGVKFDDIMTKPHLNESLCVIAATAKHIWDYMNDRLDFVHSFLRMPVLHHSIYKMPYMMRKCIPISDTDSSVFSMISWIQRYCPPDEWFSKKAYNIGYFTSYMVTQQLDHLLAMYNAQLGVPTKYVTNFRMKNEFYFPITGNTGRVKHYYGYASAQEGNLFSTYDFIIKGVGLRGINTSPIIAETLNDYIKFIMDSIMNEGGVYLDQIFKPVLNLHNEIIEDLSKGGHKYLRSLQVKDEENYTKGENDPNVKNRRMWDHVFSPLYGMSPEPPYESVTMSVVTSSKKAFNEWLDGFTDRDLAERMNDYMGAHVEKGTMSTIRLPEQSCIEHGIPKEIVDIIHVRKVSAKILSPFYIIMESLGIFFMDDSLSRIIDEVYIEDEWDDDESLKYELQSI